MTWNLMHLARMLAGAGGIPAHGNQRSAWDAGCRFEFVNPEHRWRVRRRHAARRRAQLGNSLDGVGVHRSAGYARSRAGT